MSTNKKLIYKGPQPRVIVEGVTFIRDKETEVSLDLYTRIQKGESTLKPGTKHDFIVPGASETVPHPPAPPAEPEKTDPKSKKAG